jgi:DNA-binding phage protein
MTHRLGILMCTGVCPELASQAVLDQCFEAYGEKPMSSSELLSKTALVVAVGRLRRAVVRALSRGTRAPTYTEGARAADSKDLRTRLAAEVRRAACSVGSVECFAGLCGVSTAQLYRVLNCETSPTLDWLERVAASGGVELARVIRDAED